MRKNIKKILLIVAVVLAAVIVTASLPPVRDRLANRFDMIRAQIFYRLYPPEESVFTPQQKQEVDDIVRSTMQAAVQQAAPTALVRPTNAPVPDILLITPSPTPEPLPPSVALTGVRYENQHGLWNYCAPATLSMGLSYWGWQGTRLDTGKVLKPFEKDKNVMLYEMEDFVTSQTGFKVLLRSGGTPEVLKRLLVAGFPVIIEKGTYIDEVTTGKISWMGHYNVVTGYDENTREYIVQDSYYSADYHIPFDKLEKEWRAFDYQFLAIYTPDKESQIMSVVGSYQDPVVSNQIAADIASKEIANLTDNERFFAWFNRGTSLVNLQDYMGAAQAYDEAFKIYPDISKDTRPWRMMWYQTGPYFAYFFTGRYKDVIDLATTTLDAASEPYLEESYYWRARALAATGDLKGAGDDLRTSLKYHPDFGPSLQIMQQLGISK
jgi:tetratricopeptide (TPR) repeat protein